MVKNFRVWGLEKLSEMTNFQLLCFLGRTDFYSIVGSEARLVPRVSWE